MKITKAQFKQIINEELADLLEDEQKLDEIDWKELGHEATMGAFRKRKPIQKPEQKYGKNLPEHSLEPLTAKEIEDQYGISPIEYVRLQTRNPGHLGRRRNGVHRNHHNHPWMMPQATVQSTRWRCVKRKKDNGETLASQNELIGECC